MARNHGNKDRKRLLGLGIIALLVFAAYLLFSSSGLLRYYRLQQSLETLEAANEELRQKNAELSAEIERLKNDPAYLEEVARSRFGLIKKNELLFTFDKDQK